MTIICNAFETMPGTHDALQMLVVFLLLFFEGELDTESGMIKEKKTGRRQAVALR